MTTPVFLFWYSCIFPLFPCVDMATDHKLLVFWTSWIQFLVQHDFSVSFLIHMNFSLCWLSVKCSGSVYTKTHIHSFTVCLLCITAVWLLCSCAVGLLSLRPWLSRYRYCRMLEEGSFRGRTADFVYMFLFGGVLMTVSFNIYLIKNSQACISLPNHMSCRLNEVQWLLPHFFWKLYVHCHSKVWVRWDF